MAKQPQDRQPKFIRMSSVDFDALSDRWEATRRNQILVINRLQGIIDLARETASSPSLSPDEKVHEIQEILK